MPLPPPTHPYRPIARATGTIALLLVTLFPVATLILVLNGVAVFMLIFVLAIPWSMSRHLDRAFASMALEAAQENRDD